MEHMRRLGYYLSVVESIKRYKGYWVKLDHIVIMIICGSFCGLTSLEEIYDYAKSKPARKMLREVFKIYLIPSYSHFLRLLKLIDADELNEAFIAWCNWIVIDLKRKTIAFDGKTVRSTANMKEYERPLHVISAVIAENGLTIGQLAVNSKSNEIPAVQELIGILDVEGSVITADALNCQKKTAEIIIDKGADYVLAVKENHENLYNDLREIFDYVMNDKVEKNIQEFKKDVHNKIEKNRGRIEDRKSVVIYDIDWLEGKANWRNLKAIGMIESKNRINNTKEIRYYLLSQNFSAEELMYYTRNEWAVETMHWLLDVNLREDNSRVRNKNTQIVLNIFRKITLNCLIAYKKSNNLKTAISKIMRENLFDTDELTMVLSNTNVLENLGNITKIMTK